MAQMRGFKAQDDIILYVVKLKGDCRAGKDKTTPLSTWPTGKSSCDSKMGRVILISQ